MPPLPPRPFTPQELDFIARHPGHFDREFFERWLTEIVGEYAQHRSLDQTTMQVVVHLRNGDRFAATAARSSLTWVVFFTEDDGLRFVPMGEVLEIAVDRRPNRQPERTTGFTVEPLEQQDESG